jgi:hypothetical protein
MSEKRSWNSEPAIKQKAYSPEKYAEKKQKSLRVAKIACYSGELTAIIGWNLMISFLLFLILIMGTSALPYFTDITIDFSPETFWCRGGIFLNICMVEMVLFTIAAFGYALNYKIVEVMCIHLDNGLEGAAEVNDAAMRANLRGQMAKTAGWSDVDAVALAGPMIILTRYCMQNDAHMVDQRFFTWLHRVLVALKIILACVCFFVLLQY